MRFNLHANYVFYSEWDTMFILKGRRELKKNGLERIVLELIANGAGMNDRRANKNSGNSDLERKDRKEGNTR